MFMARFSGSTRSLLYCAAILAVSLGFISLINATTDSGTVSAQSETAPEAIATDFPANAGSLGGIPDGTDAGCVTPGPPRNVTFTVSGISGAPTNVSVSMTFSPVHTFVSDLDVRLIAPNGTTSHFIFTFTNNDDSDLAGPYTFNDAATGNWWTAANAAGAATAIPSGSYRTSNGAGALTLMNPVFAGIPTSNGTWTLEFLDFCPGDIGGVSAATLSLTGGVSTPVPDSLADFNGDGKTDYAVVRNAGGGPNGQATWYIQHQNYNFYSQNWGLASDTFVPGDYDGDGKDDIAVWRPTAQAQFFVIQSQTNTIRVLDWGLASDNASVVGDYDNDGKDDFAVYRPGASPGALSYWFWQSSAAGGYNNVQWGLFGDIPAPGDYDGDGKMDFAVQRPTGATGVFYHRYSSAIPDTVTTFGTSTDFVVPGDYDGDGKTDLCVVGVVGGLLQWTFRPSLGGSDVVDTWGLPDDYPTPGDYNGDGKADYAVWRFGTLSTFWVMRPVTREIDARQWGLNDDIPVTYTFAH